MLFNYTTVTAEHRYRGDKLRREFQGAGRRHDDTATSGNYAFGSRSKAVGATFALAFALMITLMACGGSTVDITSPPAVGEVNGFEPMAAPSWEPNWAALADRVIPAVDVPGFEPMAAPSWEPNWAALAELTGPHKT